MPDLTKENFAFLCRVILSHKAALDEARRSLAEMLHYAMCDDMPEEYWRDEFKAAVTRARAILSTEEPTETT